MAISLRTKASNVAGVPSSGANPCAARTDFTSADLSAAVHAVRALYPSTEHPDVKIEDPGEIVRRADAASDLHADWRNAIDGEGPTIRSLLQRYRIKP